MDIDKIIDSARAAIGEQDKGDYIIAPAEHGRQLVFRVHDGAGFGVSGFWSRATG